MILDRFSNFLGGDKPKEKKKEFQSLLTDEIVSRLKTFDPKFAESILPFIRLIERSIREKKPKSFVALSGEMVEKLHAFDPVFADAVMKRITNWE